MNTERVYLGDGVYMRQGTWAGEVIIETERENGIIHWIALEWTAIAKMNVKLKEWGMPR